MYSYMIVCGSMLVFCFSFFFFKQKTADAMRISDWSSDVCSSDLAYSLMDEGQVPAFERDLEFNMAVAIKDAGRFRINVFKQRGEVGMVIRAINSQIPSIEQLKLPAILKDIVMEARGLVLVVGSTGSGKSTTLAGMINHRNTNTTGHILTIEDPIEFLHQQKKSNVNQREEIGRTAGREKGVQYG